MDDHKNDRERMNRDRSRTGKKRAEQQSSGGVSSPGAADSRHNRRVRMVGENVQLRTSRRTERTHVDRDRQPLRTERSEERRPSERKSQVRRDGQGRPVEATRQEERRASNAKRRPADRRASDRRPSDRRTTDATNRKRRTNRPQERRNGNANVRRRQRPVDVDELLASVNEENSRSGRNSRKRRPQEKAGASKRMSAEERRAEAARRKRRARIKKKLRREKMMIGAIAAIVVIIFILAIILGVKTARLTKLKDNDNSVEDINSTSVVSQSQEVASGEADVSTITILGTGDNLIHEALYKHAEAGGNYNFVPYYQHIQSYIEAADIATVNQESPLATAIADPSGYPSFNTPTQAGDALIEVGFDVINQANNHALDMMEDGAIATMDYWDSQNMKYVGLYRNEADMQNIRIVEKKGIKVAFLGFTDVSNEELSASAEVKLPRLSDEALVKQLIEKAKSEADYVVVHAHWGDEGQAEITSKQEAMAQKMVDWGADLIFGNHPHVLQRLDVLKRSSDGKDCPVMFSDGNLLSGQQDRNQLVSGLLTVTVTKDNGTGEVASDSMEFLPIVTHYEGDRDNLVVYPVSMYTEQLASAHGIKDFDEPMTLSYINDLIAKAIPAEFLNANGKISSYVSTSVTATTNTTPETMETTGVNETENSEDPYEGEGTDRTVTQESEEQEQ